MNQNSNWPPSISAIDERLAKTYYSNRRYNPILFTIAGIGLIAIFLLTQSGILGESAPQLLYIGAITLLFALADIPLLALTRQNKGISAILYGSASVGFFAILLTFFWQGILPIAILISLMTPVIALRNGLPRKYIPLLLLILGTALLGMVYIDGHSPVDRLQFNSPPSIASLVYLIAASLLLLTITVISQNKKFKSLQGLLLTSFVFIVTIPIVMTAALSAIGAYTNNQTQTFDTLEAVTTLKLNQIQKLIEDSQNDTIRILTDTRFTTNALEILAATNLNPILEKNFRQVARTRLVDVLGAEEEAYDELMVLDLEGNVLISTIPAREGSNLGNQTFFEQGVSGFYSGFATGPAFGSENLVIAAPIFDTNGQDVRGVLVLRSGATVIKSIMAGTPGFTAAETYLVDTHFNPVTLTRMPVRIVNSKAALDAIRNKSNGDKTLYSNYAGQQVLGYYEWFAPLQVAVIAEVPLSFVISNSIRTLTGSVVLALFVVAAAIVAVVISARTIADPIQVLAQITKSFAAGKLSARAAIDREDEIGALSQAYNQMAAQLQEMIGKLEQRVANRTKDLESQTLRLRVAAEIARDAASARSLDKLLNDSAELICNRFGFYHAGIFLLDNDNEYVVLVASPTEAGKKMMENQHKLRVGEVGIVGRVAATGEPRVTLDTGGDAVYFDNPYLPNTHSEMALPLKAENRVIGVLDVQSDQPQAFNEDDIAIMQILADQLATAIERTRLLQEVEVSLKELESAYGQFTGENWKKLSAGSLAANKGYRFDNVRIEPITELPELPVQPFKQER